MGSDVPGWQFVLVLSSCLHAQSPHLGHMGICCLVWVGVPVSMFILGLNPPQPSSDSTGLLPLGEVQEVWDGCFGATSGGSVVPRWQHLEG